MQIHLLEKWKSIYRFPCDDDSLTVEVYSNTTLPEYIAEMSHGISAQSLLIDSAINLNQVLCDLKVFHLYINMIMQISSPNFARAP